MEGPVFIARIRGVDVADGAAGGVLDRADVIGVDGGAGGGVVGEVEETVAVVLLDGEPLVAGAVGVEVAEVETVAVDDVGGVEPDLVAEGAVGVEAEAAEVNLVGAVAIHVVGADLVEVGGVGRAAVPFPLLREGVVGGEIPG